MSELYPTFDAALSQFRSFLADNQQPTEIQWVFRDHVYEDRNTFYIAIPIPETNPGLAALAYNAGVIHDQVAVKAIAKYGATIVATIWYPLTEQHRPQGWGQGLRYSIAKPLQSAVRVSAGWQWRVRKFGAAYRRYQRCAGDFILATPEIQSTIPTQHWQTTT